MIMDGFAAYCFSNAINMHFNSPSYDAVKYNFKTRVTQKSYWGRPDKYQLTKIGKRFKHKEDIIKYFVAHQLAGNKWVGDMIRDEDTYTEFLKRIDSLTYNFKNELEEISDKGFDSLFQVTKDIQYPKIISLYLDGTVSLETVCILNQLTGFIERADSSITETLLWPDLYNKVVKYQPFVRFDNEKARRLVLSIFNNDTT